MVIILFPLLCTIQMLTQECICIDLLDIPVPDAKSDNIEQKAPAPERRSDSAPAPSPTSIKNKNNAPIKYEPVVLVKYDLVPTKKPIGKAKRRYWLVHDDTINYNVYRRPRVYEDEKDENLKHKISSLVDTQMQDSEKRMKRVLKLKDQYKDEAPYKVGFILSLVKKSKDVLDELFNVAVKHRNQWVALEQLKVFELIVHTNVDTTNLLRQLVDIHVKHLNETHSDIKRIIMIR